MQEGPPELISDIFQHVRAACNAYKICIAQKSIRTLDPTQREILWNTLANITILSSDIADALNVPIHTLDDEKIPPPKGKGKRKKKRKTRKEGRNGAKDGFCEGCERQLTGTEIVSWRRGNVIESHPDTGTVVYQRLCNKCGCRRTRRRRLLNQTKE